MKIFEIAKIKTGADRVLNAKVLKSRDAARSQALGRAGRASSSPGTFLEKGKAS